MPGSNYPYSTGEYFDSPTLSTSPSILTSPLTNTLTPSFDPNTGKQAAYDQRWNNYLANLGKTQNKINVKKARKYFDSQFELDWNNEATSRELDFASNLAQQLQNDLISKFRAANEEAARLSKEQDAVDYKAAGYTYDEGKWNKLVIPPPSPKLTDWNAIAASKLGSGKTMNDVIALQKEMLNQGLDVGSADGKWGSRTLKAYDEYLKQQQGGSGSNSYYPDTNIPIDNPLFNSDNYAEEENNTSEVSNFPIFNGDDNYYSIYTLNNAIRKAWLQAKYPNGVNNPSDYTTILNSDDFKRYRTNAINQYIDRSKTGEMSGLLSYRYTKKFQQGGTMNNQEELQKAFMAYLIQDAAALGIQLQSEQDLQAYAQLLGEEGIQAKYQEFMQKMQGGVKARLGAKLEYYRKLKGVCPDGSQPSYFKEGGMFKKQCKACQKAQNGKKMNPVQEFKNKRKHINENDTVNTSKGPRDLNGKTKYPKWNPLKENNSYEERKRVAEKDEKSGKKVFGSACGSKLKKKK